MNKEVEISVNNCIAEISKKYNISKLEDIGDPINVIYMAISHILSIPIFDLKLNKNSIYLDNNQFGKLDDMVNKMVNENIPLQYLIGTVNIYKEEYIVTPAVLIPRSDTEILIETAIKYIEKYNLKNMLDICTGSGVVGISVSKNSSIESTILSDISEAAIEVTKQNILLNKVENKCKTYLSDLFADIPFLNLNKYDIIVGNPPYIESEVLKKLSDFVKNEPILALDGGESGLDIYIRIFNEAKNHLKNGSFVILEIGYNQAESIRNILINNPEYELLEIVKDINSKDRVVVCRFLQK